MKKNILFWDIEATGLDADFGMMLCFGYKWLGEKSSHVISITEFPSWKKDRTEDLSLLIKARDILESAPIWFTWYGRKFDVPFINTRLALYGEKPLAQRGASQHIDGWFTARYQMRMHSNRLASISDYFELEGKTPVSGKQWSRARAGYEDGINYVVKHCRKDVVMTEQAYLKIRPLIVSHPNMAIVKERPFACPRCGANGKWYDANHHRRLATYQYTLWCCKSCLGWSRGPNEPLQFKPLFKNL